MIHRELVREGRWDAVDGENVAEEIESLRREQFSKLESAIGVLLVHILKWDHQPRKRSRSWALSIEEQRVEELLWLRVIADGYDGAQLAGHDPLLLP